MEGLENDIHFTRKLEGVVSESTMAKPSIQQKSSQEMIKMHPLVKAALISKNLADVLDTQTFDAKCKIAHSS
jgi:hypothetical protein